MEGIKFVGEVMEIVLFSSGSHSPFPVTYIFLPCMAYFFVQRMEAPGSSKMVVPVYQTKLCHTPEESNQDPV
jgi:hypothetical protein